jgi:predicted RecB family nuclease
MRRLNDLLLHSASDLNAFLGCSHAAALNLRKLLDPASLPDRAIDDDGAKLIQQAGYNHEANYLAQLEAAGGVVSIAVTGSLDQRAAATTAAMREGAQIIYQATFLSSPWHGFADFLRRVERPSSFGSWSYEAIDTKLARTASPKHVLQLGTYSDLIADVQGALPHEMHLVLGNDREESFRRVEFAFTLNAAKARYLRFIEDGAPASRPEPCSACSLCGWREYCDATWKAEDHLSLVAGMGRSQIAKLRAAGIDSVAALAAADGDTRVPKLAPSTFERLHAQAVLHMARRTGEPEVELLALEPGRGFLRLPAPDPADLFFDLEGDPLHPDGLEYLWGIHWREAGDAMFRADWAHDHDEERRAFEATIDFLTEHLTGNPGAHIYHYAAYEITALRKLSTAYATREAALDALLRAVKFVDLYAITRQAVRTSEGSLSLKALEIFFAEKRDAAVTKADQSIVFYHRWKETRDQVLLDDILAYNKVDCENTEGLRDWLLSVRPADLDWWTKPGPAPDPEKSEFAAEREARREALRLAIRRNANRLSPRGRDLVAHLLDFHARAKKPEQWAVYDRCGRDEEELIDDAECISGLVPDGENWQRPDKRSFIARYRFPEQDSKLSEGSDVLHAPTTAKMGAIFAIDRDAGWVEVRRGVKAPEAWPETGALIPGWPLDTSVLEEAVERVATTLATGAATTNYQAIVDLIERAPPQLQGWQGGDLVLPDESLIDAATGRALALESSTLFIQGPPGTGKTYTSAHVILGLMAAGKRVGVSSNSHKAINNLLAKVEEIAIRQGVTFNGAKKVSGKNLDTYLNGVIIDDIADNEAVEAGDYDLIGGTAWLFAREGMNQALDYLFVDEAGQVSLGHLVAMGDAARNIILVGDQMQLGQPIQGAHPGESGLSVLDYLLEGAATIAPDRGILLDTSWRMHPEICGFISDVIYDGRLKAHPDCARQTLLLDHADDPILRPHGIRLVEMDHIECSQQSEAEVGVASTLVSRLIGGRYIDRGGNVGVLGLENILVVAPYNLQVNALKERLPAGARVGTVDKFQGQEAEVVIVSLATSSPEDLPRNVDFFYSKNRLNVAISRARTLAIVLANPKLLELDAKTVEHLRLVNTLAWLEAEAGGTA